VQIVIIDLWNCHHIIIDIYFKSAGD
jgi:hypothetical protein